MHTTMTSDGAARLRELIGDLETRQLPAAEAALIEARSDSSVAEENLTANVAWDEVVRVRSELARLRRQLDDAVISEVNDCDRCGVGDTVVLLEDGDTFTVVIGSNYDAPAGVATTSEHSPLGAALLGQARGDTITWQAPGDVRLRATIVDVRR